MIHGMKKIIIVGHSLGSVIAFDTLNRITHAANIDQEKWRSVGKIEGLITFGSPLDKLAFSFREHTPKRTTNTQTRYWPISIVLRIGT